MRAFRYPIVLWVTQRILREMSRRAPDFWSWRKAVLRFKDESPFAPRIPIVADPFQQTSENSDSEFLPPLKELQAVIAQLTARDPNAPGLAILYDRLGQVYAQRIRQGIAQNLEQERKPAIAAFQQAIDRYQTQNDRSAEMNAFRRLGNFFDDQSRYPDAIACYEKSLEIAKEIGDRSGEAYSFNGLGISYIKLGQYEQSISFLQQSLKICREIGDRSGEANSLNSLGGAYDSLKQYQRAINFYQQSLKIKREIGDRNGEGGSLCNLGNVYKRLGQYERAIEFYQRAVEVQREVGNRDFESNSLTGLGSAYRSLEQYDRAIEFLQKSLKIKREIGDRSGAANSLYNLAITLAKLGEPWKALQHYQQAKQIYQDLGLEHKVEECANAIYKLNQIIPVQPSIRAPEIGTSARATTASKSRRSQRQLLWLWSLAGVAVALIIWWLKR